MAGYGFDHLLKIVSRGVKFPDSEWAFISSQAKDLVQMLLQPDINQLPSVCVPGWLMRRVKVDA